MGGGASISESDESVSESCFELATLGVVGGRPARFGGWSPVDGRRAGRPRFCFVVLFRRLDFTGFSVAPPLRCSRADSSVSPGRIFINCGRVAELPGTISHDPGLSGGFSSSSSDESEDEDELGGGGFSDFFGRPTDFGFGVEISEVFGMPRRAASASNSSSRWSVRDFIVSPLRR